MEFHIIITICRPSILEILRAVMVKKRASNIFYFFFTFFSSIKNSTIDAYSQMWLADTWRVCDRVARYTRDGQANTLNCKTERVQPVDRCQIGVWTLCRVLSRQVFTRARGRRIGGTRRAHGKPRTTLLYGSVLSWLLCERTHKHVLRTGRHLRSELLRYPLQCSGSARTSGSGR